MPRFGTVGSGRSQKRLLLASHDNRRRGCGGVQAIHLSRGWRCLAAALNTNRARAWTVSGGGHVVESRPRRLETLEVVMFIEELLEPPQFSGLDQAHMSSIEYRLLVGGRQTVFMTQATSRKSLRRFVPQKLFSPYPSVGYPA